ncbi:MAG: AHH domain-containing protein [Pseudomonadota bacterium]
MPPRRHRPALSFRAVNRADLPGHDPGLQRHHLLPHQLVTSRSFARLLNSAGRDRIGFDDFRRNGLLLPAADDRARLLGLPLHRGPHRSYNAMVIERAGQIERRWSRERLRSHDRALDEALFRLGLLQRALRRRLLDPRRRPLALNRHDPAIAPTAFDDLDAMAEMLWADAEVVQSLPDMRETADLAALAQ